MTLIELIFTDWGSWNF